MGTALALVEGALAGTGRGVLAGGRELPRKGGVTLGAAMPQR
jgi:hypothetical protein